MGGQITFSPGDIQDSQPQQPAAAPAAKPAQTSGPITFSPSDIDHNAPVPTTPAPPPPQPGMLASAAYGVNDAVNDIGGAVQDAVTNAVTHPVDTLTNIGKGIWHSLPPVQLHDDMQKALPVINSYEKARASGASVSDSIQQADLTARAQNHSAQLVEKAAAEFKKNPTRATARGITDAAGLAASFFIPGGEAADAAEVGGADAAVEGATADAATDTAATAAPDSAAFKAGAAVRNAPASATNYVSDVKQGAAASQAPAQSALRSGAQAATEDSGVADSVALDPKAGIRTLADDTIAAVGKKESALYDTLNKASGTDLKTLYDHVEEVQDALDDPTNIANRTALQTELKTTQDAISAGEKQATANGIAPESLEQAKGLTQQRYALQDVKAKLFNNEAVVKGNVAHGVDETINVDSAISNAERLNKPSKFAPEGAPTRLQQALGEKGANNLMKNLYQAQKAGVTGLKRQQFLTKVLKGVGIGTGLATGAYEVLK